MSQRLLKYMDRALSWALIGSSVAMVLVVVLQIVARYALAWSPSWTEEVARFCFVYLVSLGAGLALKENAFVSVTLLPDQLSVRGRLLLESLILGVIIGLMGVMLAYTFPLLQIVRLQSSSALQLNMAFIYFSMTLMSFFVGLYALLHLREKIRLLTQTRHS
jgi:TRAP-type transport system small permease protein